jgi:hypothetical protein
VYKKLKGTHTFISRTSGSPGHINSALSKEAQLYSQISNLKRNSWLNGLFFIDDGWDIQKTEEVKTYPMIQSLALN